MPDIKHFDPDAALEAVIRLFWKQGIAATGVQDVVDATGLNRSSLYATFGGKRRLYLTALKRYDERCSTPVLGQLAEDGRGLLAVTDFFSALIEARCSGEYARWGCMISNAHVGAENADPDIRAVLERQHRTLRASMVASLAVARSKGQLAPDTDLEAAGELLALLAHGVNLRSRAGADPAELHRAVTTAVTGLGVPRK
ncbi:helix-turn-helix domain-containing protein [Streptomyces cyaneofuscatus]|uniref:TetR/AcrR family transcriptional regulator n=1 Tax=Streptomyces cyaneofuscatus TaxID=66883 RepID=UPI0033E2A9FE